MKEKEHNRKIAIYGIGIETKKILPNIISQYDVIGLLDSFMTEGNIYGQPIISIEKAISEGISLIIVVARPGSCKAITKRIANICVSNNIGLYDIRGKNLLADDKIVYDYSAVEGYTYDDLLSRINQYDVVSFDLFDTLIMRTVASVTDVYELVNSALTEKGVCIDNFVDKRIAAEKKLARVCAPTLCQIYREVLNGSDVISAEEISDIEYGIDTQLIVPRYDMLGIISKINNDNKKVYITSDTYYSREQLQNTLSIVGVTGYEYILASCEYGTGKTQDLFEELKRVVGTNSILHVGDDVLADISSAKKHGIDAFHVYSGADLLDMTGGFGLYKFQKNLADRIKIGMFVSSLFNSPFQFETDKKIKVSDAKNIGNLFFAPILIDFVVWFRDKAQEDNITNILFGARDGYLIKAIFEIMYPLLKSHYFFTSRISAIRAGIENEADIIYVNDMKFSGSVEDNLYTRFGIEAKTVTADEIDDCDSGLLKYKSEIMKSAFGKRKNNKRYIDSLNLDDGDIVFFDFVAKGTSQMFVERLFDNKIKGLYFMQLEPDNMKDKGLDIESFYSGDECKATANAIFDDYYILETILTSPEPSIDEFDENGKPVYATETRNDMDIDCVMKVQKGILDYAERFNRICPAEERIVNKALDEAFLSLIHNIVIEDETFLNLVVEDPFFNRRTDVRDVL